MSAIPSEASLTRAPVTLIAAVAENGVIGSGNAIPWRLPSDFAQFKRATMGKPLIMGRRTFESIGKPLAGRYNIVVSWNRDYRPYGVVVMPSFQAALDLAEDVATHEGGEVMIGGGAEIYRQAMPFADQLRITHVKLSPEGDTHFPPIDPTEWELAEEIDVLRSPNDSADYAVKLYRRRGGPAR